MNCSIHLFRRISIAPHSLLPSSTKPGASAAAASCICWPEGPEAGPTKTMCKICHVYTTVTKPLFWCAPFPSVFSMTPQDFISEALWFNCSQVPRSWLHYTTWWPDDTRAFKPDVFPPSLTCGHLQSLLKMDAIMVCVSYYVQSSKESCSFLPWGMTRVGRS